MSLKTVHVVFKTHLDLGFTDLGANVTRKYVQEYIPRAIALARELKALDGLARFVWTTGSWLIHEALRLGSEAEQADLIRAIEEGDVFWHALPMTTHTECMDPALVRHAIAVGRNLDARFGRHTTAAKMTDVPGHTIGLVPFLKEAGIDYLHLGVNGASPVPEVPEFFIWQAPSGAQVVVNYSQSYGAVGIGAALCPSGTDALYLAHTGDNLGPPSAAEVAELFAQLQAAYPGAQIVASTLDAFARSVTAHRELLPVLTQEIGDSWIHGVGSDPILTARLRALYRLRDGWLDSGELATESAEYKAFSDALLLVPEHTWGMDLKTYLPDYVNYEKPDFAAARARDLIDPTQNPAEFDVYAWAYDEATTPRSYSQFESSWAEQRGHLDRAIAALDPARASQASAVIAALATWAEVPAGAVAFDVAHEQQAGAYRVRVAADGSLEGLADGSGRNWAGPANTLGAYSYQTFDERDEQRFLDQYCRDIEQTGFWAIPDQTKPGLRIANKLPATVFTPTVTGAHRLDTEAGTSLFVQVRVPDRASEDWGAPRSIALTYTLPNEPGAPIGVTFAQSGRDASRLPDAGWLGFNPLVADGAWHMSKLGTRVDPSDVVKNGNRRMHVVDAATKEAAGSAVFTLRPIDSPLVTFGAPHLFTFDHTFAGPQEGLSVNLHNNMWGTNFTMWFEDDLTSRFEITLTN